MRWLSEACCCSWRVCVLLWYKVGGLRECWARESDCAEICYFEREFGHQEDNVVQLIDGEGRNSVEACMKRSLIDNGSFSTCWPPYLINLSM